MRVQKFIPDRHCTELVRPDEFIRSHPFNEGNILRTKRVLYYHVNENPDRSFIQMQAAVKMGRAWMIWPAGFLQWVEHQTDKTLQNYAA